mmetsp:Transcript_6083/g.6946  ORF Transcript_6083/g.6946 Transcript_6083/m.6946 type:complete len:295 (+) Transcript_6083:113-997(+)|eukprot:CAMPEP_0197843322 /NCGR_PEP_ID=MMETSP1438-20131217/171_1 /TAXON_ID=1461541 /ORGANISM="Pterosperma sp., Strain CCMP1384" /LENGTH=294 /DNA_ID=CAMNT_0043453391 /DNA_START=113 /DNA_END=997 /DNA_ORIENTATION=+
MQAWTESGGPVCESTANADEKQRKKDKTVKEGVDFILSVMQNIKSNNYTLPNEGNYEDTVDMAYMAMNFPKGHRLKHDTWQEVVPYGAQLSSWKVFKRRLLPTVLVLSALVVSWLIPMALSGDDFLKPLDSSALPVATTLHWSGTTFIIFLAALRLVCGGYMLLYERLIMKEKHHDFLENLMLATFIPGLFELVLNLDTLRNLPGDAPGGVTAAAVIIPCLHMSLVPLHATWNMCTGWMLILTLLGPKSLREAWRKYPGEDGWEANKEEEAGGSWLDNKVQAAKDGLKSVTAAV